MKSELFPYLNPSIWLDIAIMMRIVSKKKRYFLDQISSSEQRKPLKDEDKYEGKKN